jgi:hypothetical protein
MHNIGSAHNDVAYKKDDFGTLFVNGHYTAASESYI